MMRPRRPLGSIRDFLSTEAGGGVLLAAATLAALVWANSPWSDTYDDFWRSTVTVGSGSWAVREDLQHWVNDALMVVFFFLIGLEVKRELVVGQLRDPRTASLPVLAAIGGMVVPAVVFAGVAGGGEVTRGWAIPMATDIAFVVGLLAVLGPRAPQGLKIFLLTLAIVDDIGAIAVIAIAYSSGFSAVWLSGAAATLAVVVLARRAGLSQPIAYLPFGVAAWYCTYRAGIHPTMSGVALGLLTPAHPVDGHDVLERLEHRLGPWSSYLVIPVFALANAGVSLGSDVLRTAIASRLSWAVALGLFVGKTVGITGLAWAGTKARAGRLPSDVEPGHLVGGAALAGIGFTVSLFITGLAFASTELQAQAKIGILVGSLVAGILGAGLLSRLRNRTTRADEEVTWTTGSEPVGQRID